MLIPVHNVSPVLPHFNRTGKSKTLVYFHRQWKPPPEKAGPAHDFIPRAGKKAARGNVKWKKHSD